MNNTNTYYPVFCDLRDRLVIVVGGGMIASRKIEPLIASGAKVKVIAREVVPEISSEAGVEICLKDYSKGDLEDAFMVIAATDDEAINNCISRDALSRHILCNVVDKPDLCSFIVPSVVEKGPIKIAISTGGASPALARRLRMMISTAVGDEYAILSMILGKIRPFVLSQEGGHENHKRVFDILVDSQLIDAIRDGDRQLIDTILFEALGTHIDLKGILP